ncbi:hypothetical protein BG015_005459 [Linnemannia schmuckeri]|uniref:Centrosomin N-terminal motif 1 domain-containing protein n=1 Tax=Linnemannia schmuckeri TaxID=64567 RepID=A0A9P5VC15_9FUNG|nr:hypothetical protein BG015_005459 [Linnemannia schmuckeri]
MEHGKWTASPEQSLLLRQSIHGLVDDDEEGEESRLDFNFDAIDADIDLDDSVRSNPRMTALSGHVSSAGMTDTSEGPKPRKTIDRWSAGTGKPAAMTLKEQERIIDELKKEGFELKLKIFFLEERLAKISPEHVDQALQENIEMKVKLQTMYSELKQYKRLLMEAHAAIEALQAQRNSDLQNRMTEEQEEEYRNAIAEALDLKATLKQLSQQIASLEQLLKSKDTELEQLQSRVGELDSQANTIEELRRLNARYEGELEELHDQLISIQQNESRLMEKSRVEEGWEARCRELEKELNASLGHRSQLEKELSLTQADKATLEEEMNLQLEQHRDELSKAKIDAAELSNQLENEREQMHQIQEMHTHDMNTLSERWTLDRQQLREQISDMSLDINELRKANEQLEAHVQDLMAMRNEEAIRHDQELGDLVGEFEEKEMELARAQEELRNFEDLLQARDARISELLDRIDQLEMARQEADAVHDEVVSSIKSKMMSGSMANLQKGSVSQQDFQLVSEELALIERENRTLQAQLRAAIDQKVTLENSSRDRDAEAFNQWKNERQQLELEYTERIEELQEKLAAASDQIAELSNDLNDREGHLQFYEEKLAQAARDSKDVEERYEEMELRLSSDLEATTAELVELRKEFEQIRANRVEKSDLLHSRTHEVDRLTRKLNVTVAAMEDEKEQMETALRDRATTIAMLKSRLTELEMQVSKKQRDDDISGETSKSDLVERNSLLLTVLQHLESILGGDSRLDGNMLPKPSANFVYFSNHLISRLKSLSKLFILFEKKGKELEDKATSQLVQLKRQLDMKLKQLDRFETIVRDAADRQRKWREQLVKNKAINEDLQAKQVLLERTIADLRARSGTGDRAQDYEARCKHAERKLQLEKTRSIDAEERWNARLRELEKRTKDAEERVKRERQGAKEKVAGLLDENKTAQKNIENLQRKNAQLQELVDIHKGSQDSQGGPGTPYGSVLMQNSSHIRTATELGLSRMNDQLRSELDQRSKIVEKEREKTRSTLQELDTANAQCYQLQQQLGQRENQIKGTLNRIEMLSQRKEVAESMVLRQATQDLYRSLELDHRWD